MFTGKVVEEYDVCLSQIILPIVPRCDYACEATANGKHVLSDRHLYVINCFHNVRVNNGKFTALCSKYSSNG